MTKVYVGDVGTEITLDCGTDVSAATQKKIVVRKPSGARLEWTASLQGSNYIKYVTQAGDIDMSGVWKLQAAIDLPEWSGTGEVALLVINTPL